MALEDAFDMACAIKHDLEELVNEMVLIVMLTDNISLFDVITKATITADERLMVDLSVVKDAYRKNEIEPVGFIISKYNGADALTKKKTCDAITSMLETAKSTHPIE